jgi:hypothetical protein
MRLVSKMLFALAALGLSSGWTHADVDTRTLRVGSTGILCYMEPCPWRGIVDVGRPHAGLNRPLWWGNELPPMEGPAADKDRIVEAWDAYECVLVEGDFDGRVLRVNRLLESC